jgi:hypothetical protein
MELLNRKEKNVEKEALEASEKGLVRKTLELWLRSFHPENALRVGGESPHPCSGSRQHAAEVRIVGSGRVGR